MVCVLCLCMSVACLHVNIWLSVQDKTVCIFDPMSIPYTCIHLHVCISLCHVLMLSCTYVISACVCILRLGWTAHVPWQSDSFHRELKQFKIYVSFFCLLSLDKSSPLHAFPLLKGTVWPPGKNLLQYNRLLACVWLSGHSTYVSYGTIRHDRNPESARDGHFAVSSQRDYRYGQDSNAWLSDTHNSFHSDWAGKQKAFFSSSLFL